MCSKTGEIFLKEFNDNVSVTVIIFLNVNIHLSFQSPLVYSILLANSKPIVEMYSWEYSVLLILVSLQCTLNQTHFSDTKFPSHINVSFWKEKDKDKVMIILQEKID